MLMLKLSEYLGRLSGNAVEDAALIRSLALEQNINPYDVASVLESMLVLVDINPQATLIADLGKNTGTGTGVCRWSENLFGVVLTDRDSRLASYYMGQWAYVTAQINAGNFYTAIGRIQFTGDAAATYAKEFEGHYLLPSDVLHVVAESIKNPVQLRDKFPTVPLRVLRNRLAEEDLL